MDARGFRTYLDRKDSASYAGWFIGGAALGAAVTLLLAPQSGSRTRKLLGESADQGKKSLIASGQEIFEKGRELFERGREIAEEAAEAFEKTRRLAEKKIEERF